MMYHSPKYESQILLLCFFDLIGTNDFGCEIRYIVSDCDAVKIIYDKQGYAKTPEDAGS